MTTYKTTTYETTAELRNAINSDLEQLAYPFTVKHKTYGEGQLTFVKAPLTGGSLYAIIDFAAGTKTLALDILIANRLLEMPEDLKVILLEAQTAFRAEFDACQQAQRLADRQEQEQAREAAKKAAEDKKKAEKYEATKAKAIKDFEALAEADRPIEVTNEFYYALGWLAKHIGSISARLPDYLSDIFRKHFGSNVAFNAVDSKKKTVNGNSMQWTFGFTATLRKPENIPASLTQYLGYNGKQIANTSFIWDLVDNYGFQFGKQQNIDQIRSHVPSDCLASFEAGLA
jgi:hypothetical protein